MAVESSSQPGDDFAGRLGAAAADAPVAERRVALALHGMTSADRHWMLERLPELRRAKLLRMLDELSELGLPPEPQLVRDACAPVAASANAALPLPPPLFPAEWADRLLAAEPDAFVVDVLRLGRPDWRRDALAEMTPRARDLYGRLTAGDDQPAPARAAAIARVLAQRVAGLRPPPAADVQPKSHLLDQLARWRTILRQRGSRNRKGSAGEAAA